MQMLLGGRSDVGFVFRTSPYQVAHHGFSALAGSPLQHTGGPYSFMRTVSISSSIVTQPLAPRRRAA